ncbi:unnamed protein product, partial [Nippostrongylus brasiliensis]|uniref:PE family protein n=1 Tax=Nippostrongylus brasiliensis TaxID=27835 RepID=A0A0N4YZJ9_NIPBR
PGAAGAAPSPATCGKGTAAGAIGAAGTAPTGGGTKGSLCGSDLDLGVPARGFNWSTLGAGGRGLIGAGAAGLGGDEILGGGGAAGGGGGGGARADGGRGGGKACGRGGGGSGALPLGSGGGFEAENNFYGYLEQ